MCDRRPERLVGGPLQECREALPRSIDLPERNRLVLASEVVVEGPQRDAGPVGDVFAGDVLQPPLKRELQSCVAERQAGTELLAFPQPQRGGHKASVAKSCTAGKIARQADYSGVWASSWPADRALRWAQSALPGSCRSVKPGQNVREEVVVAPETRTTPTPTPSCRGIVVEAREASAVCYGETTAGAELLLLMRAGHRTLCGLGLGLRFGLVGSPRIDLLLLPSFHSRGDCDRLNTLWLSREAYSLLCGALRKVSA